jgi:hypothetical protein
MLPLTPCLSAPGLLPRPPFFTTHWQLAVFIAKQYISTYVKELAKPSYMHYLVITKSKIIVLVVCLDSLDKVNIAPINNEVNF